MKKIIYIILFAFAGSLAITACTEDEVGPTNEEALSAGGGSGSNDKP